MGLMKAPGLITFLLAVTLAVAAVIVQLGLLAPVSSVVGFWILLAAFGLMILGVITRGL